MAFGGDYNPEQWPEQVWTDDVELMRRAGVTFVTVGVFAWAASAAAAGHVRGRLARSGARPAARQRHPSRPGDRDRLATTVAGHRYPEIIPVDERGMRYSTGSRQTWCPSSPVYRDHALALVERLATRYGDHPAVTMWHVSNELGCHNLRCYCPVTTAHFRRWLEQRYGDIAALNRVWGTSVLEPGVQRVRGDPVARAQHLVQQPDPAARLRPLQLAMSSSSSSSPNVTCCGPAVRTCRSRRT